MLARLKALLMDGDDDGQRAGRRSRDEVQLAAATLLVEAARMDDTIGTPERTRIRSLLEQRFSLTGPEADDLLAAAETETEGPAQWHRFTSTLKAAFPTKNASR
jgi:uncharacterized tellurite resistance protein B-like protein